MDERFENAKRLGRESAHRVYGCLMPEIKAEIEAMVALAHPLADVARHEFLMETARIATKEEK